MKLDPDSVLAGVGDFTTLATGDFSSGLPSRATIDSAWADPASRYLVSPEEMGEALATTSVRALRFVSARAGVEVGIPAAVISDFTKLVAVKSGEQAISVAVGLTFDVADVLIDVATEAMGAVPFVGWVGKLVKGILDAIEASINRKRPKPPVLVYDEDRDQDQARGYLKRMRSLDWSFLFQPSYVPERWDDWTATEQSDGGYIFMPKSKFDTDGAGAVPGGPLGSRGVQSRNCWDPGTLAGLYDLEKRREEIEEHYSDAYRIATECILDVFETTPSVSRIALAAWQTMTQSRTANLFQVDTRGIADQWDAYVSTAIEASRVRRNVVVPTEWVAWRNLESAMYVRNWKVGESEDDGPKRTSTLAETAARYINDLRKRQLAALETDLAAYANRNQAAFRDPAMLAALMKGRRHLLQSNMRWSIDIDDVVDHHFRGELAASLRGPRPDSSSGPPRMPVPDALPLPTPDDDADTGGGGGGAVLGVGLALLGGWGLRQYLRSRR